MKPVPVSLRLPDGSAAAGLRITIQSDFPAPPARVWELLQSPDTLRFICRPLMYFEPEGPQPAQWVPGQAAAFRLRAYGIVPLGRHVIRLERIDPQRAEIQSREAGALMQVWDHLIALQPGPEGRTRYTDQVDLYAGWLTRPIAWWASLFYRHRQRRWLRLLTRP
ncbi:MAG: hypothetical protein NW241_04395 [Bacteroidia bacterium]|nr:hypothetical protein [Bacteroidia bacterium]